MNKIKSIYFYYIFIIFIIISLFVKSFYQFPDHDETFILTLTQRIINGDKLFINEWNASQLTGYINLYVFGIYRLFFSNYNYIVIFERIMSLIIWILLSIYIYLISRPFLDKKISFLLTSFILLIFSSTIINIQYNIYSVGSILFTFFTIKYSKNIFFFVFAGLVFSIGVLAHPLNILFYFIILFMSLKKFNQYFTFKEFMKFSILPFIHLIIFLLFLLHNKIDFFAIIQNFKYILSHANTNTSFLQIIIKHYKLFSMFFLFIISIFDKNRYKHKKYYIIIQSIFMTVLNLYILKSSFLYKYWYYYNIPLTIYFLQIYFLTESRKKINILYFIFGIIYAVILNFMSDTQIFIIALGLSLSIGFGFEMVNDFFKTNTKSFFLNQITLFIITVQLIIISIIGYTKIDFGKNQVLITDGPFSGLILNQEKAVKYNNDIKTYKSVINIYDKENKLLIMVDPKLYLLSSNSQIFSYSSFMYFSSNEELADKLNEYYYLNPEKMPNIIYFIKNIRLDENNILDINYIIKKVVINDFEILLDSNEFYAIKLK